jgi:hypothetical protein
MPMLAVLIMTASACSTPPADPVVRTEFIRPVIPAEAKVACLSPVKLPDRALTAREVTTYWGGDRASLRICEQRRKTAVAAGEEVAP